MIWYACDMLKDGGIYRHKLHHMELGTGASHGSVGWVEASRGERGLNKFSGKRRDFVRAKLGFERFVLGPTPPPPILHRPVRFNHSSPI